MKNKQNYFFSMILAFTIFSCENSDNSSNEEKMSNSIMIQASEEVSNLNNELMLQLVNEARSKGCDCRDKNGKTTRMPSVPVLQWNDQLTLAAKKHSEDMLLNNYFSHDNLKGESVGDRVSSTGYKWSATAENIAKGQISEKDVFDAWMNSYGHCKNIMNNKVNEMGAARTKTGTPYWTQVFAVKAR